MNGWGRPGASILLGAEGKPFVSTLATGFCNVTSAAFTLPFDAALVQAVQLGSSVAQLSPIVDPTDMSADMLMVDADCHAVYEVGRAEFSNISYGQSAVNGSNVSIAAGATPRTTVGGAADGFGSAARFNHPTTIVSIARGDHLIVDEGNHVVRRLRYATGGQSEVTTVAGRFFSPGDRDGSPLVFARFSSPASMASDGVLPEPTLYVADTGNGLLRSFRAVVTATSVGDIGTAAGRRGFRGVTDGPVATATLDRPFATSVVLTTPSVRTSALVYFSEQRLGAIRRLTISTGVVDTLTGTNTSREDMGTGILTGASDIQFYFPTGIAPWGAPSASPSGSFFIVDAARSRISLLLSTPVSAAVFAGQLPDPSQPDLAVDGSIATARFSRPYGTMYVQSDAGVAAEDLFRQEGLLVFDGTHLRWVGGDIARIPRPAFTFSRTRSRSTFPTPSRTLAESTSLSTTVTDITISVSMTPFDDSTTFSETMTLTGSDVVTLTESIPLPTPTLTESATISPPTIKPTPRVNDLMPASARGIAHLIPDQPANALAVASEVLAIFAGFAGFPSLTIAVARNRAAVALALCPVQRGVEASPSRGVHWLAFFSLTADSEFGHLLLVVLIEALLVTAAAAVLLSVMGRQTVPQGDAKRRRSEQAARMVSFACIGVFAAWAIPAIRGAVTVITRTYFDVERVVAAVVLIVVALVAARLLWVTASPSLFHSWMVVVSTVELPRDLQRELMSRDDLDAETRAAIVRHAAEGGIPGAHVRLRWRDRHPDVLFGAYWHALLCLARDPRDWLSRNLVLVDFLSAFVVCVSAAPFARPHICEGPIFPAAGATILHIVLAILGKPYRGTRHAVSAALLLSLDVVAFVSGLTLRYHDPDTWNWEPLAVALGFAHVVFASGAALAQIVQAVRRRFATAQGSAKGWRSGALAHDERFIVDNNSPLGKINTQPVQTEVEIPGTQSPPTLPPAFQIGHGANVVHGLTWMEPSPVMVPHTATMSPGVPALPPRKAASVITAGMAGRATTQPLLQMPMLYSRPDSQPTDPPLHDRVLDMVDDRPRKASPVVVDGNTQGASDGLPVPLLSSLHARRRVEAEFHRGPHFTAHDI